MFRKTLCLTALLLVLPGLATSLYADDQTVFGPRNCVIGWTHIYSFFHIFSVDDPEEGVITITKNTPDKEIRGGFVLVNFTLIPLRDFLGSSDLVLEEDVSLEPRNLLMVFLRGTPGASLTIEVRSQSLMPPPEVTFSANPESLTLGASSTLTWTTAYADSVSIDHGIGSVAESGSLDVLPTETTTYTLTAVGAGGTTTQAVIVTVTLPPPTVNISADPETIVVGESTTLSWTSTDADSASIDQGLGSVAVSGSIAVSPTDTTTYTITVSGPGGTATASATVTVTSTVPTVTIYADPNTVEIGWSTVLHWSSTNADSASIDQGVGTVPVNGSVEVLRFEITTFTITVTGPGGTATASATVTVTLPPPTVNIFANPEMILLGESSTLSWNSVYADTCVIEPDIGAVDKNGSITVSPTETTMYTITATGSGGTDTKSVTVRVDYLPPTVDISANPKTILLGESSTLTWSSNHADTCVIEPDVGNVETNGSVSVSPTETTTYTIMATGSGGDTATDSVTIHVYDPSTPLTVTLEGSPETIAHGESSTLSWTSTNCEHAHIDNGIGVVSLNGSTTAVPDHTTTYTITVSGPAGSASSQVTISVTGNPEPQPEGSFGEQYEDMIPPDATVESYNPGRFSIITGLARDLDNLPVADVSVNIHGHPEYGTVQTDADGRFSIPVEGGGTVALVYQKNGLIRVHRKVYVPWNDIATAETIQMIAQDPAATMVTFDGDPETVVTHESTEVTDDFGTRSCSMVFTGDNAAYLVDEDGNDVHELITITTRATEYTIPESMPAILPPTSAYTYCAELVVDGAQRVRFEKPVVIWVDNFLGFEVGEIVPVGYFDRDRGLWVPSDNGVVIRLLDTDTDGTVDALDVDGDHVPDDLNEDGSFSDEVTGLSDAGKYPPNSTFWRFAVTHFTPWDCNWPFGPPLDAIPPNPKGEPSCDAEQSGEDSCNNPVGSYVNHRSRVFHEDISVPGTEMTLHYSSNRARGYKHKITVPASGETVPDSLKRIVVTVNVAGQTLVETLNPLPNLKAEFVWDGLDQFERPVTGPTTAHIGMEFFYDAVYYSSGDFEQAFGQAGSEILAIETRQEIVTWKQSEVVVHPIDQILGRERPSIAEGWTLSSHHHLSPRDPSTLHKGDGTTNENNVLIISTIAGNGTSGYSGDGGPALEAQFNYPGRMTFDAAGNLYIGDATNYCIRKVDTQGIITTVAGNGTSGYSGDGGPATEAQLAGGYTVAVDPSGNLYIGDGNNYRVRKVDTNGIITTIAGNGTQGYSGDGGPATEAQFASPYDVVLDSSGNLYISEAANYCIRKVDTNGIVTTVVGNGTYGYSGDGGPATEAQISGSSKIAFDAWDNLYICDLYNYRVRKVDTSGIITTVVGNGTEGFSGDGGPATEAALNTPRGIAVDPLGNLYFSDYWNRRFRMVDTSGIITTIAGFGGSDSFSGDGGPATEARFRQAQNIAVDPSGNLYVGDSGNFRVRKIAPAAAFTGAMASGDIPFAEKNGLGHIMSSTGRHKKTIDLDTGITFYDFGYNDDKELVSITDRFGNQTTIERDPNGEPTSITSPDGITTTLTIDDNNHLTHITYRDGNSYDFEYTLDGLLTAKIEPEGNRFEHVFDFTGRLTDATDDEAGHWNYARNVAAKGDILTEVLTGEGNLTSYLDHTYSTGAYTSTITDPTGGETLFNRSSDGLTVNKSLPCGMELDFQHGVDSEYKFKRVKEMQESTPSALTRTTLRAKTYEDTDSNEVPDLITETVTVNGKATTLANNVLQSQKTITSPEGRTVTTAYDPVTLLTSSLSIPGLFDMTYGYDARGRLTSTITNTRETSFAHNAQGFLDSITDPENHTTSYTYDAVGRMTGINRPDSSSVGFTYDQNGNMTILTNPSTISHGFGYNGVNLNSLYQTPISGSYTYLYDKDRRLVQTNFPSGNQINNVYDKTRLTRILTPEGNIDLTYLCGTKVGSITNETETITYGYDGKLVTSETLSGTLNQSLEYTYNNDFNLNSFTYAGDTHIYTYDDDGLLTGAGGFTVFRNAGNGLPEAVTGGALSLARTFNGYGEVEEEDFVVNGSSLTSWELTRDDNGRISEKAETADGVTSSYAYTYDAMGRLLTVTKDSTLVEEYRYSPNGTRTYEMNALRDITGRTFDYSDEDHLLTAGNTAYQYSVDGFLTSKTHDTDVTLYDYSSRGELLSVTLPGGTVIDYVHDPLGRRIAKAVNGVTTEKYLWQGLTRLLAVFDGSDNLIVRFEYADGRMPVAMTKDGSTYYLTYDQVGSLRIVADASGTAVKRIDYDSFGNVINDTNSSFEIPFGFAAGLHDRDTGLVRFGFRDYDPDIGRWTAKDPILFAGGDTDLYGYCLNDPVNFIDPEGQVGLAGVIIGGVAGAYGGLLSGLQSGNTAAGIIGGVAGAVTGALVGVAMPHSSSVVGGMVGGVIAGAFGGAVGGATGKALSDPCASAGDIGRAAAKGAGVGVVTGAIGGGLSGAAASVGLGAPVAVRAAGQVATAPIGWGLGMLD